MEKIPNSPNNNETIKSHIDADFKFLSKFKDTDSIPVLITIPGIIPRGEGFLEPANGFEEDSQEWHTYSVKELKDTLDKCKQASDLYMAIMTADYPLSFKDPVSEEEHDTALKLFDK